MYHCHICGAPLDYPGTCSDCGSYPVYNWMNDDKLKEETEYKENKEENK